METFSCLPKISPFLANSVTRYSMLLVSITCGYRNHTLKEEQNHPKGWKKKSWFCLLKLCLANNIKSCTESEKSSTSKRFRRTIPAHFGFISITSQNSSARFLWIWFCILFMNRPEIPKRLQGDNLKVILKNKIHLTTAFLTSHWRSEQCTSTEWSCSFYSDISIFSASPLPLLCGVIHSERNWGEILSRQLQI